MGAFVHRVPEPAWDPGEIVPGRCPAAPLWRAKRPHRLLKTLCGILPERGRRMGTAILAEGPPLGREPGDGAGPGQTYPGFDGLARKPGEDRNQHAASPEARPGKAPAGRSAFHRGQIGA